MREVAGDEALDAPFVPVGTERPVPEGLETKLRLSVLNEAESRLDCVTPALDGAGDSRCRRQR